LVPYALWNIGGREACDFMLYPSRNLGPGWQKELSLAAVRLDRLSTRAHCWVSRFIEQKIGLSELPKGVGIDRAVATIALLPPARLEIFVCYIGAALAAQEVRQAIRRTDVDAYKQVLGEGLYQFVMWRAPLLGHHPAARDMHWGPEKLLIEVRRAGRCALARICDVYCAGLWPRVRLRLQHESDVQRPVDLALDDGDLRRFALRIMREIEPEWTNKFYTGTTS
jgi:hypothetical protein